MPDPATIAAKLTKAQRKALLEAENYFDGFEIRLDEEACEELEAMGLTGRDGWIDQLTPLGLAVRDHLKGADHAQG